MNILLVGAMKNEIDFFINNLEFNKKNIINGFCFYECKYQKHNVYLVESGIGRTMAGVLIGVASSNYKIDKVINIGIAGGVKPITIKDVIACSQYVYGDVDVTFFNYEYGQMAQCPKVFKADEEMLEIAKDNNIVSGTVCTCDSFTSSIEAVNRINKKLSDINDIICFDMESCAFAQACYFMKLPFIAIRSVSDIIGDSNQNQEYSDNEETPAEQANRLVLAIINHLK